MPVELIDLGHGFPGQPDLFSSVNQRWLPGTVVAVTGPSGSGKSTLLSILAGWLIPKHGEARVPDHTNTAWVFQNPHGVSRRSALDHVTLPLIARGLPRREAQPAAVEILKQFQLSQVAARPFGHLSGGEAQRLMLARAVATAAELMLVDEPTAQLDPANAASVIGVLGALSDRGAIVVIATHDPRVRDRCEQVLDLAGYAGGR
jgi:ABC-type lipoprotein export system ATPase subunit